MPEHFQVWSTPNRTLAGSKGVSELRIDVGPGYRIYYATRGDEFIVLLAGDDKSTQARDIENALALWEDWRAENR